MTASRSIAKQSLYLMVGNWGSFIISFLIPMVLVRMLTVDDYGIYSKLVFVYTTGILIVEFGIHQSVLYYFNLLKNKKQLVLAVNFYYLCFGLIVTLMILVFKDNFSAYFQDKDIVRALPGIILYFIFFLSSFAFEFFLIVEKKSIQVGLLIIVRELFRALTLIGAAWLYGTIESIIWALAGFAFVYYLLWLIYILRNNYFTLSIKDHSVFLKVLTYSVPLGMAGALNIIGTIINKFFVGLLLTNYMFSVFAVGSLKINVVNMVFKSINHTLIPNMVEQKKRGKVEDIKQLWHKAVKYAAMVSIPTFYFFYSIADRLIVLLFTEKYIESIPVFRISVMVYLIGFSFCGVIPRVFKKTRQLLYSNILTLSIAFPLNYIIIRHYAVRGAVVSGLLTMLLLISIQLYINGRLLGLNIKQILPWRFLFNIHLLSSIPAIPILMGNHFILNHLLAIISAAGTYLIGYLLLLKWSRLDEVQVAEKLVVDKLRNRFK